MALPKNFNITYIKIKERKYSLKNSEAKKWNQNMSTLHWCTDSNLAHILLIYLAYLCGLVSCKVENINGIARIIHSYLFGNTIVNFEFTTEKWQNKLARM
jgi:hypothetical protein